MENFDYIVTKKLDKVHKNYCPIELCKQLERLRKWALAGIQMFELPAAINNSYNEKEIDFVLMRYCYYRLIYFLTEKLIIDVKADNLDDDIACAIEKNLVLSPIGCRVTDDDINKLCKLILDKFGPYYNDALFGDMTAYDVAKEIIDNNGITKKLLVKAIINPL